MERTILITGSTDGIGKLAALTLASKGYKMYLHGRNAEKLSAVIAEVKAASSNDEIHGFVADFSDLEAVRQMTNSIQAEVQKIDVLINNAGVFKSLSPTNQAGMDMRFAVNYFAPFVLTNSLIPLLDRGHEPRIINLSSAAQAPVEEDVLLGKRNAPEMQAYSQSKLAITMWSTHLAKTHKNIIVIPVNPGSLLDTNMVREAFGQSRASADKGSDILVQLSTSDDLSSFSGTYYDNDIGAFGKAHAHAYDELKIENLLHLTSQVLEE